MASPLIDYLIKKITPQDYYKSCFPNIRWGASDETKVLSPWTEEKVPSLSINRRTGAWFSFCDTDKKGGKTFVSFHAALHDLGINEAAADLFHQFIHPVVPWETIRRWHRKLMATPSILKYLQNRKISNRIVRTYQLGWDGTRIMIPVLNEFGLCVNVRRYLPKAPEGIPKILNYVNPKDSRDYGSPPMIFPISVLQTEEEIVICEGESDTLSLLSQGVAAVTNTTGSQSWPEQYSEMFAGKRCHVAYDNDKAGISGAKIVARNLMNVVGKLDQVTIPKKYGKDINDCLRKGITWSMLLREPRELAQNTVETTSKSLSKAQEVSLIAVVQSECYGQRISTRALISGKDNSPYLLPRKYRVVCRGDCEGCPLVESASGFVEVEIDTQDPEILGLIDLSESYLRTKLLNKARVLKTQGCRAQVEHVEMFNIEHLMMIPTLDQGTSYVMRTGYYVGHGIQANRPYAFTGIVVPHPHDQKATLLFDTAQPVYDDIDTFQLSDDLKQSLRVFQPGETECFEHLLSIAQWQSEHITRIHERYDLHMVVDLAFHSVGPFEFNKEPIRRGMLDVLIMGDTRCGKGYVTEGLSKFYHLGDIASGDNCSFAGLVGGLQQSHGNRWFVTWGKIPLNNNRLVIIDEASSMTEKDIARMSRIRSEGVAEINKIIQETTQANTRLIWLANPRSNRSILTYNTGVEAIMELMGAPEDVSRLDLALTVATNEVASEVINVMHRTATPSDRFSADLFRNLILWTWSRRPEQIVFTRSATELIIQNAIKMGHNYSPRIPLVQAENMRIKLAKISAAVAARVFSTDHSCEKLMVKTEHVVCACRILNMVYTKRSMGYDVFSKTALTSSAIESSDAIEQILNQLGATKNDVITGLVELHQITPDTLADYTGDSVSAKILIGDLVKARCVSRISKGNWYLKNPAFSTWLRSYRRTKK